MSDIQCDCGHDLRLHFGTSEGDRLPQPCAECACDDFVESETDDASLPLCDLPDDTSEPRTEAGQTLIAVMRHPSWGGAGAEWFLPHILAIEAEARRDERQKTVAALRAFIEWLPTLIDGRDRAENNSLIRAAIDEGGRIIATLSADATGAEGGEG